MSIFANLDSLCDENTPFIVRQAMKRIAENHRNPAVPAMSKEEYENLDRLAKFIMTCNMPGCGEVVCTHGMLCVKHNQESKDWATNLAMKLKKDR